MFPKYIKQTCRLLQSRSEPCHRCKYRGTNISTACRVQTRDQYLVTSVPAEALAHNVHREAQRSI